MLAIALFVFGLLVSVGSFVFAAVNMGKQVKGFFSDSSSADPFSGIAAMFTGHLAAMVGMIIGGLIATIGVVLGIVQIVQMLITK